MIFPGVSFVLEVRAQVGVPIECGPTSRGRRRVIPILEGTFEGPHIAGRVVPGGADWQIIHPDGFTEVDARYTLQTSQGQFVHVRNAGVRHAPPEVMAKLLAGETVDPALVYFRSVPSFETTAPELKWLERSVFIGTGERYPSEVVVRFWKVE